MYQQAAQLLQPTRKGLYCPPGDFYIDPVAPVDRAVVTHGHGDHARSGHGAVLATPETLAIMATRYGDGFTQTRQTAAYGATTDMNGVRVRLVPAGHVLGSAQAVIEHGSLRIVVSGDYKRRPDLTCPPFEPVPCDVFVSEATFALPVFRHPDDGGEVDKLLSSVRMFPDRAHLVGAYALGKAQRLIRLIRERGHDGPVYLHGALQKLCNLYEELGVPLGELRSATGTEKKDMAGQIVMCPPGQLTDKWARRLGDPVTCFASGWMRVRARARQRGVDLPLIISDHADWDELLQTIDDVQPGELWVTHGREEALIHAAGLRGIPARPLSLVGYEEEGE